MKYIGNGSFMPGIPARDLTDDEVKLYGKAALLDSGLYVEPINVRKVEPKPIKATEEDKPSWQE